jgi:hypothetical protein
MRRKSCLSSHASPCIAQIAPRAIVVRLLMPCRGRAIKVIETRLRDPTIRWCASGGGR